MTVMKWHPKAPWCVCLLLMPLLAGEGRVVSRVGETAGDRFGFSVADAGDVNGDGVSDLVVGAPFHTGPAGVRSGKVYVYSGAPGHPLLRVFFGRLPGDFFGTAVAGAGDVDEDGFADLVVGAPLERIGLALTSGRAFVFSGRSGTLLHTLDEEEGASRFFGHSVASAGDMDGDGCADVAVGGHGHGYFPAYPESEEIVSVFSGRTGQRITTFFEGDWSFRNDRVSIAPAGDVDGDGRDEIVVSFSEINTVRLYKTDGQVLKEWSGDRESAFGRAVATADVDGDGIRDIAVGAPFDGRPVPTGNVSVFRGSDGTLLWSHEGEIAEGRFGWDLSFADVDGDGDPDLLVGAPGAGTLSVFAYEGGTGRLLSSRSLGPSFGFAVAGVADIDGNGADEVVVGAPKGHGDDQDRGEVTLFLSGRPE